MTPALHHGFVLYSSGDFLRRQYVDMSTCGSFYFLKIIFLFVVNNSTLVYYGTDIKLKITVRKLLFWDSLPYRKQIHALCWDFKHCAIQGSCWSKRFFHQTIPLCYRGEIPEMRYREISKQMSSLYFRTRCNLPIFLGLSPRL
jgi:hypothetical protein